MILLAGVLFAIASVLSMFGKGGGEFYVPVFVTAGVAYQQAATTSLFILMVSGTVMTVVFHKKALIDWKTGALVILSSATGAFLGGFVSSGINPAYLKLTFSALLLVSAYFIARPPRKKAVIKRGPVLRRRCCGEEYEFPVAVVSPAIFAIGFLAGMVGISGGGLIVPLLIILGDMPLRVAFATNSVMVLFSSSTGFLGHGLKTRIDWHFTLVMAFAVALGAVLGANLSTKVNVKHLKKIFVWILAIAAFWMAAKIYL